MAHFCLSAQRLSGHGPGARLLIGEHREGTRFTRAMADLAIFFGGMGRDLFAELGADTEVMEAGGGRWRWWRRRDWVRGRDCGLRKRQRGQ